MQLPHRKPEIRTFEEMLLTDEEQQERRKADENDRASAAFYRQVFEDPEAFFITDAQIQDTDI